MSVILNNNAVSRLASSLSSGATTLSVTTGEGGKFPSPAAGQWFPVTIIKASGSVEIVRCTARTGDVLTITRAQEGSAAQSFAAGDRVELRATAAALLSFLQLDKNLSDLGSASAARDNLGLTEAAITALIANSLDATAGKILTTGAFGLGTDALPVAANIDTTIVSGMYKFSSPIGVRPGFDNGVLLALPRSATEVIQFAANIAGDVLKFRRFTGGVWAAWRELFNDSAAISIDYWAVQPIGVPIPVWDHMTGVTAPPTTNAYRYCKLTASDSYNSGVLGSESVSGSAPLVIATAGIVLSGSPMTGATVNLINTERRFLRGGSVGAVEQDAFQGHEHEEGMGGTYLTQNGAAGTVRSGVGPSNLSAVTATTQLTAGIVASGSNGTPRTANETRPKSVGVTYYMRVK